MDWEDSTESLNCRINTIPMDFMHNLAIFVHKGMSMWWQHFFVAKVVRFQEIYLIDMGLILVYNMENQ